MNTNNKISSLFMEDGSAVILRGLSLKCIIGIDHAEKHVRQPLLMDVVMDCSNTTVDNTPKVDYHAVVRRLKLLETESRHGLMEDFAEEVAAILLNEFNIERVCVYCRKPKPLPGLAEAGVEIVRSR